MTKKVRGPKPEWYEKGKSEHAIPAWMPPLFEAWKKAYPAQADTPLEIFNAGYMQACQDIVFEADREESGDRAAASG